MDETQSYLNSILKKRLGSVVNYAGSAKTANTVTRIPKQQQRVQSMPTVFRKKHETVYVHGQNQGSHYSQIQSKYMSMKQGTKGPRQNWCQQIPQQNKQSSNQRVEYMLISKRIHSRKQDQFTSPTVDVTSYAKNRKSSQINVHKKDKQHEYKSNIHTGLSKQVVHYQSQDYLTQRMRTVQQKYKNEMQDEALSKISKDTDKSKRKRIFGQ